MQSQPPVGDWDDSSTEEGGVKRPKEQNPATSDFIFYRVAAAAKLTPC